MQFYKHQKRVLDKFKNQPPSRLFLNWAVGTGKGYILARMCKILSSYNVLYIKKEGLIPAKVKGHNILYITQAGAIPATLEEFKAQGLKCTLLNDFSARARFMEGEAQGLILTSYATFRSIMNKGTLESSYDLSLLVLDECHKFYSTSTQNFKSLKKLVKHITSADIICASGISVEEGWDRVFAPMYFLNPEVLGKSYWRFRNEYFYEAFQHNWKLKEHKKKELAEKVSSFIDVVKREDLGIEQVKKRQETINCSLSGEQARAYKSLKARFYVELGEARAMQDNLQIYSTVLSQLTALRQVCSGFVYEKDTGKGIRFSRDGEGFNKLDYLESFITLERTGKVLVFFNFRESGDMIEEMLKGRDIDYVRIDGRVNSKKRIERIDYFKNTPSCKVYLGQSLAGGTGLNLPEAKYAVFYERNFSFNENTQAEGRNNRINSLDYHKDIIHIDLKVKNSIEEFIRQKLKSKRDTAEEFYKFLKEGN